MKFVFSMLALALMALAAGCSSRPTVSPGAMSSNGDCCAKCCGDACAKCCGDNCRECCEGGFCKACGENCAECCPGACAECCGTAKS